MPSPKAIIDHLSSCLSQITTRFNNVITIESATVSSNVLTLTITDHSLLVDQQIFIQGALIKNKITAVELAENALLFTTEYNHDLTAYMEDRPSRQWPDGQTVTIEELETYELDPNEPGVPSKTTFQTIQEDTEPTLPTLTGSEYLLENRVLGVNGRQIIQSITENTVVIDLNAFETVPSVPDGDVIVSEVVTNVRLASATNIERAQEIYTSQKNNEAWLFLITNDRVANKSRSTNSDNIQDIYGNTINYLRVTERFSILVFIPTDETIDSVEAESLCYDEIFNSLLSCLYGWEAICHTDDGKTLYNTAYYGHAFDFESVMDIDNTNGWKNNRTVAFRKLDYEQTIFDEGVSNAEIELPNETS